MQQPAISVIIPMFNAARYIGDCLDSLLAQTFTDFELIIVDDCSTDNGVEVVKSFAARFGERLKLSQTKKNSGGAGSPRNKGLALSQGKYIYFMDADDFVTKTALEEFLSAAENFGADVVYNGSYYEYTGTNNAALIRDTEGRKLIRNGFEDKPTLTVDDPEKNLQRLLLGGELFHMPWAKLVRRDFLIENEITFPQTFDCGDFIWTIEVLYYAKRLLRISTPLYFYREDAFGSITRKKKLPDKHIADSISQFLDGVKILYDMPKKIDLLNNQIYFCAAINLMFCHFLIITLKERMNLDSQEIYEALYRGLVRRNDSSDVAVPFLFSFIDLQQKDFLKAQQRIDELEKITQQDKAYIAELEKFIAQSQ